MKTLAKFFKLSYSDRVILTKLLIYIVRASLILHFMPYKVEKKLIFRSKNHAVSTNDNSIELLKRNLILLNILCRNLPWKVTCLRKAVALRDSLASEGIDAELKIGTCKSQGKLVAHAWLKCCGIEVLKNGQYLELRPESKIESFE